MLHFAWLGNISSSKGGLQYIARRAVERQVEEDSSCEYGTLERGQMHPMFVILDQLLLTPFEIIIFFNHELRAASQRLSLHGTSSRHAINSPNNNALIKARHHLQGTDSHPTFRSVTPTLCELNLLCLTPDDQEISQTINLWIDQGSSKVCTCFTCLPCQTGSRLCRLPIAGCRESKSAARAERVMFNNRVLRITVG